MELDINDIDVDRLRDDLIDYFTGAYFNVSPVAVIDMTEVENASDYEVIKIASQNGFNLLNYLKPYQR